MDRPWPSRWPKPAPTSFSCRYVHYIQSRPVHHIVEDSPYPYPSLRPTLQRDTSNTTTHSQITSLGRAAHIYTADLSSASDVSTLAKRILDDKHDVSILVTAAGIQRGYPAQQFPDADWNDVLQVNLHTVWTLCRDFGAYMLTRPGPHRGNIVNVASLVSFQGAFTPDLPPILPHLCARC